MTKRLVQRVRWKLYQKDASAKEINEALRSVMNPQQYLDFLTITKALEEEKRTMSQSKPNTSGHGDPALYGPPDEIRLRLIAEAITERSR